MKPSEFIIKSLRFVRKTTEKQIKSIGVEINKTPIIVLGNQKSGTSAIAHLLADYGNLSKTIDIDEMFYIPLSKLLYDKEYFCKFVRKNKIPFSKELIKEPGFTFMYDSVKYCFPDTKRYIMIIREPKDNIRSILNRLKIPGDLEKLDLSQYDIPKIWKSYFKPDLWKISGENYIEILAERWNKAADIYLNNKDEMILVKYEDFIKDKVNYINNLATKIGIEQKKDITPLVDIQYQPKGNRKIGKKEFFGEKNLKIIEKTCGSRMKEFGYKLGDDK